MRTRLAVAIAGLVLVGSLMPLLAHHSITSTYDSGKTITLKGTVARISWQNPHVWLSVDVTGEDGKIVNWRVETLGTNNLMNLGLNSGFVKPTDPVSLDVWVAKDGAKSANALTITLPDGRTVAAPPNQRFLK